MKDLLKLALEALEEYVNVVVSVNDPYEWTPKVADAGEPARKAIIAIKEALAEDALQRLSDIHQEMEQQPVTWSDYEPDGMHHNKPAQEPVRREQRMYMDEEVFYTAPTQQVPIKWTLDGDKECLYNNWLGETPFGRILITWKGWKNCDASVDEFPGGFQAYGDPDEVKADCEAEFTSRFGNTPPQRKPLTDEEIKNTWIAYRAALPRYLCFARAIEAKLKEKNHD